MSVEVRPVTKAERSAFEALFSAKGCPGFCWCTPYRFEDAQDMERDEKRLAMLGLIDEGTPVGVLAFDGEDSVGWCSVAPGRTYANLARSRTMPTVDEDAWTILRLFIKRDCRGQCIAYGLVVGAVEYAESSGAEGDRGVSVGHGWPLADRTRGTLGAFQRLCGSGVSSGRLDEALGAAH